MSTPLELEWWASALLGEFWQRCAVTTRDGTTVRAFQMAGRFVDAIGSSGHPAARTALRALDALERGPLGKQAYRLAIGLTTCTCPEWVRLVGHADAVQAVSAHSSDGDVMFIEFHRGTDDVHTVATYIDHHLGGAAKQLMLVQAIDTMLEKEPEVGGEFSFVEQLRPLDPVEACRRLCTAIEVTDGILEPPVGEGYASLRAVALTRALSAG